MCSLLIYVQHESTCAISYTSIVVICEDTLIHHHHLKVVVLEMNWPLVFLDQFLHLANPLISQISQAFLMGQQCYSL